MTDFLFATGIENSYPTIAGGVRVDEMEKCGHYRRWRDDFTLVSDLGIRYLRWGPALYRTFTGPGRYDWGWSDEALGDLRERDIEPILDLCHFGVPDWVGSFQNPDFPRYFAEYAGAFARRHAWVRFWTPVNEMLITTLFSAKYGWWNERQTSDAAFVRATANACKASRLAMRAIRQHVPEAVFVQSESFEYYHPETPSARREADFLNERRFLPLDLNYGRPVSPGMRRYLAENGLTEAEYAFFLNAGDVGRCILGIDYYVLNEHYVRADGSTYASGELHGFVPIALEYYERYRLPLMHTETNRKEEEGAADWLDKQWHGLLRLRRDDVPVVGFTWFSLTDQMDWDTALREDARRVNAVGLFDLDRQPRVVGQRYRDLIRDWADEVPVSPHHLEGARPQFGRSALAAA